MKFYYTILKVSPNPASGDAVSIGLLAFSKNEARVLFSESRKILAKKLIPAELVDFLASQVSNKVNELNKVGARNKNSLFEGEWLFEPSHIDYLSNYSNGLLQFSKCAVFLKELNDENLKLLFEVTIDKFEEKKAKRRSAGNIAAVVDEKLIQRVKERVHTNVRLDGSVVPHLYFSFEMDCIGKNGEFVGAKSIDFQNRQKIALDKELSHYFSLISFLTASHNKDLRNNAFYLIAEQPSRDQKEQFEVWDSIQDNPLVEIISPDEADKVAEKIEESNASTFLS